VFAKKRSAQAGGLDSGTFGGGAGGVNPRRAQRLDSRELAGDRFFVGVVSEME